MSDTYEVCVVYETDGHNSELVDVLEEIAGRPLDSAGGTFRKREIRWEGESFAEAAAMADRLRSDSRAPYPRGMTVDIQKEKKPKDEPGASR